jgi:hypothetical protein
MRVAVAEVPDCPHAASAVDRVAAALKLAGHEGVGVDRVVMDTVEQADRLGAPGSPTILADGRDLFPTHMPSGSGLACRLYPTPDGPAVVPTVEQLVLLRRPRPRRSVTRSVAPVLPSSDLDRTEVFYAALGLSTIGRKPRSLLLHRGRVELHFTEQTDAASPGDCFIHVPDAVAYWKQLMEGHVSGVSAPAEQDRDLIEFVVTDPDGNRVRFGSPAS